MDQNDREMLTIELTQLHSPDVNHDGAPAEESFEMQERVEKRLRRTRRQPEKQTPSNEKRSTAR
jgi:hypothetical protein